MLLSESAWEHRSWVNSTEKHEYVKENYILTSLRPAKFFRLIAFNPYYLSKEKWKTFPREIQKSYHQAKTPFVTKWEVESHLNRKNKQTKKPKQLPLLAHQHHLQIQLFKQDRLPGLSRFISHRSAWKLLGLLNFHPITFTPIWNRSSASASFVRSHGLTKPSTRGHTMHLAVSWKRKPLAAQVDCSPTSLKPSSHLLKSQAFHSKPCVTDTANCAWEKAPQTAGVMGFQELVFTSPPTKVFPALSL